MLGAFNARNAEEGRSFMSGKQRGETRLGEKVFGDNFTLRSEIGNPILRQTPDRPGRPGRQADHLGREGRRQEPLLRSLLGAAAEEGTDRDRAGHEPGDGRRHDQRRGDDQDDQARPAGVVLLVHPAGRQHDAAQHRHDARRAVPDRERRDRGAGAELPLERIAGGELQQHHGARAVDPDAYR